MTGGSLGSDNIGVMGREFRMASISMTNVLRCSYVKTSVPTMRIRWRLNDFTAASHRPPKWGELGGLKRHCIFLSVRKFCIFSLCSFDWKRAWSSFNSLLAPTKLVPLSESIVAQCPHRDINRRKAAMKASVVRSLSNSICAALVARHMKMAT
jgi:hypothetical protein